MTVLAVEVRPSLLIALVGLVVVGFLIAAFVVGSRRTRSRRGISTPPLQAPGQGEDLGRPDGAERAVDEDPEGR
ncbi:hypothetical protein [Streptomyces corynorhini]